MVILGIGVDIVCVPRITSIHKKYGDKFLVKALHPYEIIRFKKKFEANQRSAHTYLASRWAVKEAVYKVLSAHKRIPFPDIQTCELPNGKPTLQFHNLAIEACNELGVANHHLSLSHDGDYSIAYVIFEKKDDKQPNCN